MLVRSWPVILLPIRFHLAKNEFRIRRSERELFEVLKPFRFEWGAESVIPGRYDFSTMTRKPYPAHSSYFFGVLP